MKYFAEINNGIIRKIYEYDDNEQPMFASYIKLIEITDIEPSPQEGWYYIEETNTFSEEAKPVEQQPTLEEIQAQTLLNTELLLIYKETGV